MASHQSGQEELHLGGAVYCSNLKILPLEKVVGSVAGMDSGTGRMEEAGTMVSLMKHSQQCLYTPEMYGTYKAVQHATAKF